MQLIEGYDGRRDRVGRCRGYCCKCWGQKSCKEQMNIVEKTFRKYENLKSKFEIDRQEAFE